MIAGLVMQVGGGEGGNGGSEGRGGGGAGAGRGRAGCKRHAGRARGRQGWGRGVAVVGQGGGQVWRMTWIMVLAGLVVLVGVGAGGPNDREAFIIIIMGMMQSIPICC